MGQALKVIKFDSEEGLESKSINNNSKFPAILLPLRTVAIVTAILGVISLILEVRIYFQFRYEIYLARLIPTLFSFITLILLQTRLGRRNHIPLTHIYLITVLASISFVGYNLPSLFMYNLIAAAIFVLTLSLFFYWGRVNQIIAVSYFIILFGTSAVLAGVFNFVEERIFLNLLTSIFLLIISIIASHLKVSSIIQSNSNDLSNIYDQYNNDGIDKEFFANSLIPMFQCKLDGDFIFVNNSLRELLDLSEEVLTEGINFFNFVLKNEKVKKHLLKKIENKGRVENYRLLFTSNNSNQKVLLMDCKSNIVDEEIFLEGSLRDFTAQHKKDKLLRVELDELKHNKGINKNIIPSYTESDIKRPNVISRMGHELRAPMNSVLGFLTLIENGLFENEQELKEFSHSAKLSAESLLGLIIDIVEISKIQDGSVEIVKSDFNPRKEIDKILLTLEPHLRAKELSISTKIEDTIPENLVSDPLKYGQILTNLLRNAVQVSESGEIGLELEYKKNADGKYLLNTIIKDCSNGITEEDLYNLLNFEMANLDKDIKVTGSILHIMISRELALLLDGNFSGTSEIGQGTIFNFEIDVERKTENVKVDSDESFSSKAVYMTKAKLLLVEDNPISRKVEQKLLQEAGYDVDCVDNAVEAIEHIQTANYNLVLMDIELKGVNGLEATQKIRLLEEPIGNIPIIAVTAHSSMKDREKCLVAGMNDYISKPINITFLKMTIDQWLQKASIN